MKLRRRLSIRTTALVLFALTLLALAACAPGPNPLTEHAAADGKPAGFLLGLWHGVIVWVTFVLSLFSHSVSIYEVHNTGWPYNLGFLLGAAGTLGGGVASSKRAQRQR